MGIHPTQPGQGHVRAKRLRIFVEADGVQGLLDLRLKLQQRRCGGEGGKQDTGPPLRRKDAQPSALQRKRFALELGECGRSMATKRRGMSFGCSVPFGNIVSREK